MGFQPDKCSIMQITKKRINKVEASYSLAGAVLKKADSIKYLGVKITHDIQMEYTYYTHISNMCIKANRTLGFLRRNLYQCPQNVKEAAYKGLIRPVWQLILGSPRCCSSRRNRKSSE